MASGGKFSLLFLLKKATLVSINALALEKLTALAALTERGERKLLSRFGFVCDTIMICALSSLSSAAFFFFIYCQFYYHNHC